MRGRLYILSGPAGVGKGTVLRRVFEKLDNIAYLRPCTTRTPRPGERDGTDYVFMDEASFKNGERGEVPRVGKCPRALLWDEKDVARIF